MSYTQLRESKPKARKTHRCAYCSQLIIEGERYKREVGVYDGDMQNHAWHLECDKAFLNELKESGEYEMEIYGDGERPANHLGFKEQNTLAVP
tara:strand:+ start:1098 stop:1376 length:279 start_codon:yes stop_codon:yes gene_type:complete